MKFLSSVTDSKDIATKAFVLANAGGGLTSDDARNLKNTLKPLCYAYAEEIGYNQIIVDLFADNSEFTLGSGLIYDSTDDAISGSGTVTLTNADSFTAVTNTMVVPIEFLGTGSITYQFSRNNGTTWQTVTKQTQVTSFTHSGTNVKIRATLSGDAKLLGWAYLVKEV